MQHKFQCSVQTKKNEHSQLLNKRTPYFVHLECSTNTLKIQIKKNVQWMAYGSKGQNLLTPEHILFLSKFMNGFCISMKYQETVERQLEEMREKLYRSCLHHLHRCSSHCLHYIQNNNGCTFDLQLAGTNRGSNLQTAATQKPHVDRNIKNCSIFDEKIATCCIHVSIVLRTQKAIDSFTKPSHPISLYTTTP